MVKFSGFGNTPSSQEDKNLRHACLTLFIPHFDERCVLKSHTIYPTVDYLSNYIIIYVVNLRFDWQYTLEGLARRQRYRKALTRTDVEVRRQFGFRSLLLWIRNLLSIGFWFYWRCIDDIFHHGHWYSCGWRKLCFMEDSIQHIDHTRTIYHMWLIVSN
jgi:hypothetical protein